MKLRILDNSLRLRLDRSEIQQLLLEGLVERRTVFGTDNVFIYALHAVEQAAMLRAMVGTARIDVFVNRTDAIAWARSEREGLELREQGGVQVLVEKDFPCKHSERGSLAEKFTPGAMRLEADGRGAALDGETVRES